LPGCLAVARQRPFICLNEEGDAPLRHLDNARSWETLLADQGRASLDTRRRVKATGGRNPKPVLPKDAAHVIDEAVHQFADSSKPHTLNELRTHVLQKLGVLTYHADYNSKRLAVDCWTLEDSEADV